MAKRQIEKEMVDYLDKKLANNGLAQLAIKNKDARTLFVQAMQACVGIREATGRNDGKMVKLIQETVGSASNEAWCMALMQTGLAYAELKTGKVSPLPAAELCSYVWNNTDKKQRVKILPLAGAIAIWQDLDSKGKLKSSGHTEMVVSCDGKVFQAVGGNTGGTTKPGQPVEANGNGCYFTVRSMKSTSKRKLQGFLIPFPKEA